MKFKYKVNNIVLVKNNILQLNNKFSKKDDPKFPVTDEMRNFAGKAVTIRSRHEIDGFSNTPLYLIEEDTTYIWSECLFTDLENLFDD